MAISDDLSTIITSVVSKSRGRRCTNELFYTLKDKGFEVLGSGVEAVAIKSEDRVIKIMPKGSPGFMHYYNNVIPACECAHTPKIYNLVVMGETIIVEMEYLQPLEEDLRWDSMLRESRYGSQYPDYKALMFLIREEAEKEWQSVDLHGGNIMVREDGTPVVTDPYYWD